MTRRLIPLSPTLRFLILLVIAVAASGGGNAAAAESESETDNPAVVAFLKDLPQPRSVRIPWRPGRFTMFRIGRAEEGGVTERRGTLGGRLYPAPGQGPAPYAVLLSGCGGTYGGVNGLWLKLWARALQDIGVGALALDSFDARGVKNGVCGAPAAHWAQRRVDDAHSALAWLASQPFVEPRRIFIMGMSNGARATLLSVSTRESWRFRQFAAAVAFYPMCDGLPRHGSLAPSFLLLGEADEGASPAICKAFAEERRATPFPPRAIVYAHAGHLFDAYPRNDDYSVPEVVDSRKRVLAFLRGLSNPPR